MKYIVKFAVTLSILLNGFLFTEVASAQDDGERAEYGRIMAELVKIREQPTAEVCLRRPL